MKITETFLSIQGEGIHSGIPSFFVRLSGCNLRCSYCDTKYSYSGGDERSIKDIMSEVKEKSADFKLVCITGGEPLIKKDTKELINVLIKNKFKVDIETNGSVLIDRFPNSNHIMYSLDIKCPSSKMSKRMKLENLYLLKKKDQVKFIIGDRKDFLYAKSIVLKYGLIKKTNVIFSPIGGVYANKLVRWVLQKKLNIRVSLQIHKVIWKSEKEELQLVDYE